MNFLRYNFLLLLSTNVFAQDCSTLLPASSLDVRVVFEQPRISSDLAWKDITNRATRSVAGVGKHTQVFGLTEIGINTSFKTSLSVVSSGVSDMVCARLVMQVAFIADTPQVFVAKELPRDTCAFKEVLEHEYRHVALQRKMLNELADDAQREMGQAYGGQYFRGNREQLINRFAKEVSDYWKPRWEARLNGFSFYHYKEVDTPAEEQRMGLMCGGELLKVVEAAR